MPCLGTNQSPFLLLVDSPALRPAFSIQSLHPRYSYHQRPNFQEDDCPAIPRDIRDNEGAKSEPQDDPILYWDERSGVTDPFEGLGRRITEHERNWRHYPG